MCWVIAIALLAAAMACDGRNGAGQPGASGGGETAQAPTPLRHVSQAEAMAMIESDAPPFILDVRTQSEYDSGHVPGAVLVPHDQLPERLGEVLAHRERLIVVYCESGRRAAKAIDVLQKAGVEHLAKLDGDMAGWRSAGLPEEH